jgi:hypothetical protein
MKISEIIQEDSSLFELPQNTEEEKRAKWKQLGLKYHVEIMKDQPASKVYLAVTTTPSNKLDSLISQYIELIKHYTEEDDSDEDNDDFDGEDDEEALTNQANYLIEYILKHCKSYITKNPRHDKFQLLRGFNGLDFEEDKFEVLKTHMKRKPLNTPEKLHNTMIQAFIKAGFKAHRGNSLFCSGSMKQIKQYGEPCVIYPMGDFNFTWSRSVTDFYNEWNKILSSTKITNLDEIMSMNRDATERAVIETGELRPLMTSKGALNITAKDIEQLGRFETTQFTKNLFYALRSKGIDQDEVLSKADFSLPELQFWLRENYKEDNIEEAIEYNREIMVHCDEAIYVEYAFFRDHVIPLLRKSK